MALTFNSVLKNPVFRPVKTSQLQGAQKIDERRRTLGSTLERGD
jgi:hypothetical protein